MADVYAFDIGTPPDRQLHVYYQGGSAIMWQLLTYQNPNTPALMGSNPNTIGSVSGWTVFWTDAEATTPFGRKQAGSLKLFPITSAQPGRAYDFVDNNGCPCAATFVQKAVVSNRSRTIGLARNPLRRFA
jgi:hypothetical protein